MYQATTDETSRLLEPSNNVSSHTRTETLSNVIVPDINVTGASTLPLSIRGAQLHGNKAAHRLSLMQKVGLTAFTANGLQDITMKLVSFLVAILYDKDYISNDTQTWVNNNVKSYVALSLFIIYSLLIYGLFIHPHQRDIKSFLNPRGRDKATFKSLKKRDRVIDNPNTTYQYRGQIDYYTTLNKVINSDFSQSSLLIRHHLTALELLIAHRKKLNEDDTSLDTNDEKILTSYSLARLTLLKLQSLQTRLTGFHQKSFTIVGTQHQEKHDQVVKNIESRNSEIAAFEALLTNVAERLTKLEPTLTFFPRLLELLEQEAQPDKHAALQLIYHERFFTPSNYRIPTSLSAEVRMNTQYIQGKLQEFLSLRQKTTMNTSELMP